MNDLQQLRRILDEHASSVGGADIVARTASVHQRVRTVRRRRRTVAAGGLAAVAAVAVGVTAHLISPPDPRTEQGFTTVVGVQAPATMTSLGYTYELGQTATSEGSTAEVVLPASDQPRLVSWATSGSDQDVMVTSPDAGRPMPYSVGDFGDFVLVSESDTATTVRVRADDGQPGIAVYTLGASRPAGVTSEGVTFRQQIAGGHLLGAAIGQPGQDTVAVPATADGAGVDYRYFCLNPPKGAFLHLESLTGSSVVVSGGCDAGPVVDAAARGGVSYATKDGKDVGVRIFLTRGEDGPRITDPDIRLALGVYSLDQYGAANRTPDRIESGGHVWHLSGRTLGAPGAGTLTATAPAGSTPMLAALFNDGEAGGDFQLAFSADGADRMGYYGGGSGDHTVPAGSRVRLELSGSEADTVKTWGIAFYTQQR